MKWTRSSGTTIDLADTPNLEAFAKSQGWTKASEEKAKTAKAKVTKDDNSSAGSNSSPKRNKRKRK